MNSKEALKVLYNYNTDKGYDARYFKIVEKDLDRLEKLETRNKYLEQETKRVSEFNKRLSERKEKLERVVEILKNKNINLLCVKKANNYHVYCLLSITAGELQKDVATGNEYELLKEVLDDAR